MSKLFSSNAANRSLFVYAAIFSVFLYLPVLLIPLFSLNSGIYVKFPLDGLTFDWYLELAQRAPLRTALYNSLQLGAVVALISTALAVPAAKAISRYRLPGIRLIVGFMMLPFVVPALIFGVALLALVNRFDVTLSLVTVAAGQIVICLPYAISTLLPRFDTYDRSIEEASADLGENALWTFWRITVPTIGPGILASLLMSFTISFDEFYMAFFLSGTDATLPIYIWTQLRFPQDFPSLLALATLILIFSFGMVLASLKISGLSQSIKNRGAK